MNPSEINPAQDEQTFTLFPDTPPPFISQKGKLLLSSAALLMIIGFFLPWLSGNWGNPFGSYEEGEFESQTVNGVYIGSNLAKEGDLGYLMILFLLMVPLGSLIIILNCTLKQMYEKGIIFGVASSVFLPLSFVAILLFVPGIMGIYMFGAGGLRLGIGFYLMGIGAAISFLFIMSKILVRMRGISLPPLFTWGGVIGMVTAVISYLVVDSIRSASTLPVYIYLGLFIIGISLSSYIYKRKAQDAKYHSIICSGFIFSICHSLSLFIIGMIQDNATVGVVASRTVVLSIAFHSLLGFVFSSIISGRLAATNQTPVDNEPELTF